MKQTGKKPGRKLGSTIKKRNISKEEFDQFLIWIDVNQDFKEHLKVRYKTAFTFLYFLGFRCQELLTLNIGQIREMLAYGQVSIHLSKTYSARLLRPSKKGLETIAETLKDKLEEVSDHKEFIFHKTNDRHTALSKARFNTTLNKVLRAYFKTNTLTTHSFRQTAITNIIQNSPSATNAKEWIGHSSVQTTLRYEKPTTESIMLSVERAFE